MNKCGKKECSLYSVCVKGNNCLNLTHDEIVSDCVKEMEKSKELTTLAKALDKPIQDLFGLEYGVKFSQSHRGFTQCFKMKCNNKECNFFKVCAYGNNCVRLYKSEIDEIINKDSVVSEMLAAAQKENKVFFKFLSSWRERIKYSQMQQGFLCCFEMGDLTNCCTSPFDDDTDIVF